MAADETAPTYEETLDHHGLRDSDMREECTDQFLFDLAKKLVRWQSVDLGLDRSVVASIENDHSMDNEGKRRQLLERWKEKFGHGATYGRLARCFIQSCMANMADYVCKERKKTLSGSDKPALQYPVAPGVTQPFTSQLGAVIEETSVRNASSTVETVDSNSSLPHHQVSKDVNRPEVCTEQEQSQNKEMSDMVASQATNEASNSKLVDTFHMMASLLSKKDANLEKKKEKVKELKGRKEQVEGYLTEKEKKIERLEQETHDMRLKLAEGEWRCEKAQKVLKEKENKIAQLQDYVFQKDRELQEEKDEKQEKCGQLRDQLEQAQADLQSETAAKEKAEAKLAAVNERLEDLQEDVNKAARDVTVTKEEYEKVKHVLQWTNDDLVEEEDELKTVIEWQRKQNTIIYTILALISMTVILAAVLLEVVRRKCSC